MIAIIIAFYGVMSVWVSSELHLEFTLLGWINFGLIGGIIFWYLLDVFYVRRELYESFGLYEKRLTLWVRMFRLLALVFLILLTVAAVVLGKLNSLGDIDDALQLSVELNKTRTLVLLSGIAVAALGWLHSNYQKQKADRAANTLTAIRDQMYDNLIALDYKRLLVLCQYIRKKHNVPRDQCFKLDLFETKLSEFTHDSLNDDVTLGQLVDRFLNALNQLALGVRQGQFDYTTVELVLRPRFIRHAFQFSEYIKSETNAAPYQTNNVISKYITQKACVGRLMSTQRTWEHFLWLSWLLPVLQSDKIDVKKMIMPPRLQYGKTVSKTAAS